MQDAKSEHPHAGLGRWIPALRWLPAYQRSWLRGDFIAGLTLAAYLLPAGLGDASLANLPPEAGLYACLFSGLVFWISAARVIRPFRSRLPSRCWSAPR